MVYRMAWGHCPCRRHQFLAHDCRTCCRYCRVRAGPGAGQVYLIIRWDETDFSVSFILSEEASDHGPAGGLRVIGTACDDTGYKAVDGWIAQDVLARNHMNVHGCQKRRGYMRKSPEGSGSLHSQLAAADEAIIGIEDPLSGTTFPARVSRDDVGRILTEHGFSSVFGPYNWPCTGDCHIPRVQRGTARRRHYDRPGVCDTCCPRIS